MSETPLNNGPEELTHQPGKDEFVQMMEGYKIPLTRENYLHLVYMGSPPEELSAEEESDLPKMFQSEGVAASEEN